MSIMPFSGKVGIGTTNPNCKFHIYGDGNTSILNTTFKIQSSQTPANNQVYAQMNFNYANLDNISSAIKAVAGPNGNDSHFAICPAWFYTGTERMRIQGDGNVGIGTSSPTAVLEVRSQAANVDSLKLLSPNITGQNNLWIGKDNTNNAIITYSIAGGNVLTFSVDLGPDISTSVVGICVLDSKTGQLVKLTHKKLVKFDDEYEKADNFLSDWIEPNWKVRRIYSCLRRICA